MAQPPILTLDDISLGFGTNPLFQGLGLGIMGGERLCLVGRNGAGKSTLLKVIAGLIEPDGGKRFTQPGAKIAYLRQEPDFSGYETLGEFAGADLDPSEYYKAEMAMEGLEVKADAHPSTASGGEKRRAALARTIAAEPDLMLLDEPTNHLDLDMRHALEVALQAYEGALILVSHDRHLLRNTVDELLLVHDGRVETYAEDLEGYERWILSSYRQTDRSEPAPTDSSRKEKRQNAAAQREKLRPLQKRIDKTEKEMSAIEADQAEVQTRLSDTDLYTESRKRDLADLLQREAELKVRAAELEESWLEQQEALEELVNS